MVVRQVFAVLVTIGFVIALLFLLFVLGLLLPILAILGLAFFLLIVGFIVIFAILSIILVPYYFITKRPKVEPGRYELEEIKEK